MRSEEEARNALLALKGRTFDGRIVDVKFFHENQLSADPPDFTDPKPLVVTSVGPLPIEVILGPNYTRLQSFCALQQLQQQSVDSSILNPALNSGGSALSGFNVLQQLGFGFGTGLKKLNFEK